MRKFLGAFGFVFALAGLALAAPTVTVISPKTNGNAGSPVFYEAYATSASCAAGINAMRIYSAPGVNAYTTYGARIETFINLAAGTYGTTVQAWDNCGGVAKKQSKSLSIQMREFRYFYPPNLRRTSRYTLPLPRRTRRVRQESMPYGFTRAQHCALHR